MDGDAARAVRITLTPIQVEEVLRAATRTPPPGIASLLVETLASGAAACHDADPRLSRSLLRGLSILTCFAPHRAERGIVEIAGELDMSPSTTHRYAQTLVRLGLLERCPATRKYRLPLR
jgi:hypothetical protein